MADKATGNAKAGDSTVAAHPVGKDIGGSGGVKRVIIIAVAIMVLTGIGFWLIAVRGDRSSDSGNKPASTSQDSNNSTSKPGEQKNGDTPSQTYPVSVFFSKHPESDDDPGKTFPVKRISADLGVAKFAISQLIQGPTAQEVAQGYFTTVSLRDEASNCGGADFTLAIVSGTAKLQFCKPFDHRGVVADGQAESELRTTLTQFNSVNKVILLNSKGDCEFDLSGENRCLE